MNTTRTGKVKLGHMVIGGGSLAALIASLMSWQWFMTQFEPHQKAYAAERLAIATAKLSESNEVKVDRTEKSVIRIEAILENYGQQMAAQTVAFKDLVDRLDSDRDRELRELRHRGTGS